MKRRAKIVATLGPSSISISILRQLLRAGVDVVRLNLSHGDHDWHRNAIRRVRELAAEEGRQTAVLMDLMGPRYRLGELAEPRVLRKGETVVLGEPSGRVDLPVDDVTVLSRLRPRERVLVDNGLVELRVVRRRAGRVTARVVGGGPVASRKGLNLPDSAVPFTISPKDRADIRLAVAESADYLAASYVGRARDVTALRKAIGKSGAEIPIVAKLERGQAVEHVDEIVVAADAVMVARGDLGVEVPLHRVPVLQKRIIDSGRRHGKPVIVATQMLESMMERTRPTRAESSDVANAVFDGADALMLSGETAAGAHPVAAVRTMARIVEEAEKYARQAPRKDRALATLARSDLPRPMGSTGDPKRRAAASESQPAEDRAHEIADVVAASAVFAARNMSVRQIVAFSQGGFTARVIARYRPSAPIVVFTTDPAVTRRMQLVWGVLPRVLADEVKNHEEVVRLIDRELIAARLARPGETILILMGHPIAERPLTNLMRIHRVRK